MNGVQRPKRWQQVILWQPLTINDPARMAFSWWNETNRIGWLALIRLVPCLSFHLYAVDFNSNIKTLTTKITESNSYLRTRTTVPHVFWNPWESKNRRVPAVYRPLFWCGRVGLGRAGLSSDALERNKENRKKEKRKEKKIAVISSLVYSRHCRTFSSGE